MTPEERALWLLEYRHRLEQDTYFMRYAAEQVANANLRGGNPVTLNDWLTRWIESYRFRAGWTS